MIRWLETVGPETPLPDLAGAPPELESAVRVLANRLGQAAPPLIDQERIAELNSLGDPSLVRHVAQTFFGGMPSQLASLRDAVARGDAAATRGVAHTIKGGAASAGFPASSHAAADLEDAARNGRLDDLDDLFKKLSSAIDRTREVVDASYS
ncbi:MAG: Hpt domain-containing protein [Proteobacteria bacterium]|nr:Hpt domain-containing protein [Pseudomonadota bacterium]